MIMTLIFWILMMNKTDLNKYKMHSMHSIMNKNKVTFEQFKSVIIDDLRMEIKESECKQIFYHQQLMKDYCLDLNEFFDQIYEEFLSFPSGTHLQLLRRYFAKILCEAAPFEKLNQFILDYLFRSNND